MTDNYIPWRPRSDGQTGMEREVGGLIVVADRTLWAATSVTADSTDLIAWDHDLAWSLAEAMEAADRWAADRFGLPTREDTP